MNRRSPDVFLAGRQPRTKGAAPGWGAIRSRLGPLGREARVTETLEEALPEIEGGNGPCVLVLTAPPDAVEAAGACARVKSVRLEPAVFVLSDDSSVLAAALEAGADACLVEPVTIDLVVAQVAALHRHAARREAARWDQHLASFPTLNPQPVAEVDLHGRVQYLNPAAERLFPDLPRSGGAAHPWFSDWDVQAHRVWDHPAGAIEREVSIGDRWYHQHFLAVRDLQRIRVYGADITDRKLAEEALRESESFYRQTLESIPGMVFTTRADGYCDYQNRQWVEYTGVPMSEHLGDGWARLLHPDDTLRAFAAWRAAVEGIAPYDLEYRVRRRDGAYEWFKVIGRPIRDEVGQVVRWFGTAVNVESLKRAEVALADADRRKDEFIAVLSHELRNPLAPIRYALPLLQRERLGKGGGRAVEVIDRQVEHLTRLVDDLLDVSRISRGKVELRRQPVNLETVLSSAVEAASPAIAAARHSLQVDGPPEAVWLDADPARLAQVVTNLLNNSAKYTPRGGEIRLEARPDNGHVLIQVRDNGIGIPPHELSTVFEMFRQVDGSQGGLGIGLALARRLVEMHGGHIEARSEGPGRGSEFVVRLPVAAGSMAEEVAPVTPVPPKPRPLRVLIVDDNPDLVEMLAIVVEGLGYDVRKALDGRSAVAAARSYGPDVVLLDLGLPVLSGIEVARELRRHPETARAWLVALTGWGQPEDRRQTSEAGFDHHLTKPTDPQVLEQLLAALAIRPA